MGDIATIALVSSGVLGAVGAISEGQAAKDQAKFQASIRQQQAQSERQTSAAEERDFRKQQSAFLAKRRAAMGASGVEQGTGSPLLAVGDFAAESELQAQRIRAGGEVRATRLEQQAKLDKRAGRAASRRGFARAGASLLSAGGKAFG